MPELGLRALRAEVAQIITRLEAHYAKLARARAETLPLLGETDDAALVVAGYLELYYTTLETLFVRVSQHFENTLPKDRWHAALLERMNLAIPDLRERVVSDSNLPRLRELLRFRHFRRYYLETEYDWRRVRFLLATLDDAHPVVLADLTSFSAFLDRLDSAASR